jgi:hypothetical protein
MQVTILAVPRNAKYYVSSIKLLRTLTGKGLKEAKDEIDRCEDITVVVPRTMMKHDVDAMLAESMRNGVVVSVSNDPIKRTTLEEAFAKAAIVTFDGLLVSSTEQDGIINVEAQTQDGLLYEIKFLANQEIDIDDNGSTVVHDIDGAVAILTFYIPMKGI